MIPLVSVLTRTETYLRERGVPSPRLEAELLLAHVLGLERIQLYLSYDRPLTDAELDGLRPMVRRRGQREPLSWILGKRGFHRIELTIAPGVLDPRPDTETLVEAALEWIPEGEEPVYVADVGCGSGCVGLAIAAARSCVRLYATDTSAAALSATRANVERLGLKERVAVLGGDLLDPVPRHREIDWVVSNPPYVPTAEIEGLMPEVSKWEPREALDGGPDGLRVIRRLIAAAAGRARKGLLLEVGAGQAGRVVELLARGGASETATWKDLGSIDRVVAARFSR